MLRGPARAPLFLLPVVAALAVLIKLGVGGHWAVAVALVLVVAVSAVRSRRGPQRPAGRVRRSWPWHDD